MVEVTGQVYFRPSRRPPDHRLADTCNEIRSAAKIPNRRFFAMSTRTVAGAMMRIGSNLFACVIACPGFVRVLGGRAAAGVVLEPGRFAPGDTILIGTPNWPAPRSCSPDTTVSTGLLRPARRRARRHRSRHRRRLRAPRPWAAQPLPGWRRPVGRRRTHHRMK